LIGTICVPVLVWSVYLYRYIVLFQPVQFSSVLVRRSAPMLQEANREYRRVSHITAEQRRRGSIKVSWLTHLSEWCLSLSAGELIDLLMGHADLNRHLILMKVR